MSSITQETLFTQTRANLLKMARNCGIKNYSTMDKQILVAQLLKNKECIAKQTISPGSLSPQNEEQTIEGSKFYLGPNIYGWEAPEELPCHYGETQITLMVRDAYCLFAYWEISPQHIAQARVDLGDNLEGCKTILRVYDITGKNFNGANANSYFNVELNGADSWYIKVENPNHTFCAELGLVTPRGSFYFLTRSNEATTPNDGPSPIFDEVWVSKGEGAKGPTKHIFTWEDWEKELYTPRRYDDLSSSGGMFSGSVGQFSGSV